MHYNQAECSKQPKTLLPLLISSSQLLKKNGVGTKTYLVNSFRFRTRHLSLQLPVQWRVHCKDCVKWSSQRQHLGVMLLRNIRRWVLGNAWKVLTMLGKVQRQKRWRVFWGSEIIAWKWIIFFIRYAILLNLFLWLNPALFEMDLVKAK